MPPKRNEISKKGKPTISTGATLDCVLHQDIMICILTRLPVKSIFRFKSVCKPWRDLFSTRDFIKMHHDQFSRDPKNQSVIIDSASDGRTMFLLNIESDEKKPIILSHPCPDTYVTDILGCCNGLICMVPDSPGLGPDSIVLWNPAMKLFKFVGLPRIVEFTDPKRVSLGFGYDAEGDDFKVVRIVCLEEEGKDMGTWVELYSVNSDSWITIEPGFRFRLYHDENLDIVNGNPYWFADVDANDSLVWLDVRKMVFKVVPLVTHNFHVWEMKPLLMDWKGSLGALVINRDNEMVNCLDVWVFDDDEQTWRNDHIIGPIEVSVSKYLLWSGNGKILSRCPSNNLIVLDPNTGWVKVFDVQPLPLEFSLYLYTESLTCIAGMRLMQDGGATSKS